MGWLHLHDWPHVLDWPYAFGFAGAALAIASYWMQGIIRLRLIAIFSNILALVYGVFAFSPVTVFQNLATLPLNFARLRQMRQLVNKVETAAAGDLSMDWLRPFMTHRRCRKGDVIFRRADIADAMYVVASGEFRLMETFVAIDVGQIVGEIGLLTQDQKRTQGLECVRDGELLVATYAQVKELYYQNPEFGFYFLKLVSRRLLENIATLESEIARLNADAA